MVSLQDRTSMCLAAASVIDKRCSSKGTRTSVIGLPGYQGCGEPRCSMMLSCRFVGDTMAGRVGGRVLGTNEGL